MKSKVKISTAVTAMCFSHFASAQEWLININVPGIDHGVMADVVLEGTRAVVTVQKYPTHLSGEIEVMSMRVSPFGTDVTPEACAQVKNRALMFTNTNLPDDFRARAKQQVREATAGTVVVKPSVLTGTVDFNSAVKAALTQAGIPFATFDIKNRWNVTSMRPKLVLEPDALSEIIGAKAELEAQLGFLGRATLNANAQPGSLAAYDLLCDLSTGKAKLTLEIAGEVPSGMQTRMLLPLGGAERVAGKLQSTDVLEQFLPGIVPQEKEANLVIGGFLLNDILRTEALPFLKKDLLKIHSLLFDNETKRPLIFSDYTDFDALMRVEETAHATSHTAVSKIAFVRKND
jgi:hypothetical protein